MDRRHKVTVWGPWKVNNSRSIGERNKILKTNMQWVSWSLISPGLESEQPKSQNWVVEEDIKSSKRNPLFLIRGPGKIPLWDIENWENPFIFFSLPCPQTKSRAHEYISAVAVAASATQIPKTQKRSVFLSRGAGSRGPCGPKNERRIPVFLSPLCPRGRPSCGKYKTEQWG